MAKTPKLNDKIKAAKAAGNQARLEKLQAQKQNVIAKRESAPAAVPANTETRLGTGTQGGLYTSMDKRINKQQNLLDQGKYKKAAKVGNKILQKAKEDPTKGYAIDKAAAESDFKTNLQANRPNQTTIGGSRQYITNPDGSVSVIDSLDQGQQGLYDDQIGMKEAANQAFMQGIGGLSAMPNTSDLTGERQRIEDDVYTRETRLLDKNLDRERKQLMDRLYETGNPDGTPAFKAAMDEFDEGARQQYDQARTKATATAGEEFSRSFNIGSQGRAQGVNELGVFAGLGGGPTVMPNFFGFNPVQMQSPQFGNFLGYGLERELGIGALDLQRQKAGGGGGGIGGRSGAPAPQFSLGGLPSGGFSPTGGAPNPVGSNFAQGVGAGAAGAFK